MNKTIDAQFDNKNTYDKTNHSTDKDRKIFRDDLKEFSTVFALWAMISGVIAITANKKNYIELSSQENIDAFLNYSFSLVYKSLLT